MQSREVAHRAQALLAELAGPKAQLRPEQAEAIDAVVRQRRRALVVQRTGFGKSAIYFIATHMLRDAGQGPTLLVSPLLALMRDQVAAAARMGVHSETINSTNVDEWQAIEARLAVGQIDLLCISPERLNNPRFARRLLPGLASGLGLLVVDEAHCISDWGHDFRPDYRRIRDAIANLAPGTPVVATTATATGASARTSPSSSAPTSSCCAVRSTGSRCTSAWQPFPRWPIAWPGWRRGSRPWTAPASSTA